MIVGQALAGWFADRGAQAKTLAAVEAFGRRLRQEPALAALDRELAVVAANDGAGILASARRFLESGGGIALCVEAMAAHALVDPFFRPGLRTAASEVHDGLVLFDRPMLTILLGIVTPDALAAKRASRAGPASVTFGGQQAIFRFLRGGGAWLSFWEAPVIEAGFTAAASGRCRLLERRRIEDGETVVLDGRRHSFVIDHAASDLVYLHALTPAGAAPLAAEYDADSLVFAGASSTDEAGSRVQMMLSLLRAMDRRDAAPLFVEVLGAPHFHARWHAMREFLALDAEQALPYLRDMAAADSHAEVREAAAQALDGFFSEESAREEELAELCPA